MSTPVLTAPFDVLGSPDLSKYCKMHDSEPVLPRQEEVSTAVPDHLGSIIPEHAGSSVPDDSACSVPKPQGNPREPTPEEVRALEQLPVVNEDKDAAKEDEDEEDEDDDEENDDYEAQGYASDRGYSAEESAKDYTACSASDCGYCGRCGY